MYQGAVQDLIDELGRLPGVGPKSAQRIAFYILNSPAEEMEKLTAAIYTVKAKVSFCEICGNISETPKCSICRDARRDQTVICVVEEPKDVSAIERTGSFNGRYHVLGGSINPMQGIGPERLRIRELVTRLSDEQVQELILAMDPNLEGEATATYLSRMLAPIGITLSRLASGLPVGGDLEYADEITLGRALEGRRILTAGQRQAVIRAEQERRDDADPSPSEPDPDLDPAPENNSPQNTPEANTDDIDALRRSGASASGKPERDNADRGHATPPTSEQESTTGQNQPAQNQPIDDPAHNASPLSSPAPNIQIPNEPARKTPNPDPYRRYPTPRRGEKFANPWAD